MLRLYKYFYYRMYYWDLKGWKDPDVAAAGALVQLSVLICLNIWTTLAIVEAVTGVQISFPIAAFLANLRGAQRAFFYISGFVAITLLTWMTRPYWKRVIEEFDKLKETKTQKIIRAIGLWLYCIVWAALWYASTVYSAHYL